MNNTFYDVEVPCTHDKYHQGKAVGVSVWDSNPSLINLCTVDGGIDMNADEVRQLINVLQKALEITEPYTHAAP